MAIIIGSENAFESDLTVANLIEEVLSNLQGFSAESDQITSLAAAMASDDLTVQVTDPTEISRGLIEIGDELLWVQSADPVTGTATLLPHGRGWRGTAALSHEAGQTVVISPNFPRSVIMRELCNQIRGLYPNLFAVSTLQFDYTDPLKTAYEIPDEAEAILDVRTQDHLGNWQRVRRWEVERGTDTPSGNSLRIGDALLGYPVRVVYGAKPVVPESTNDALAATGLPASCKDVIVLGAMVRLIPMLDVARLTTQAVPADELDTARPLGSALAIAKDLRATYEQRLAQERRVLTDRYPARIHWTR